MSFSDYTNGCMRQHHHEENPYKFPGTRPRQYSGYSAHQEELWQAWTDFYWSRVHGWQDMRLASPMFRIKPEPYRRWRQRVLDRSEFESKRDKRTRAIREGDYSEQQWEYLYERYVNAARLRGYKPTPDNIDEFQNYGTAHPGGGVGYG